VNPVLQSHFLIGSGINVKLAFFNEGRQQAFPKHQQKIIKGCIILIKFFFTNL